MKLYLTRPRSNIQAVADYDITNKTFVALKNSIISSKLAYSEKFRGSKSIAKSRIGVTEGTKVIKDVPFKSASTAANFVTGTSTNGLIAWKDENGKALKLVLAEMEERDE